MNLYDWAMSQPKVEGMSDALGNPMVDYDGPFGGLRAIFLPVNIASNLITNIAKDTGMQVGNLMFDPFYKPQLDNLGRGAFRVMIGGSWYTVGFLFQQASRTIQTSVSSGYGGVDWPGKWSMNNMVLTFTPTPPAPPRDTTQAPTVYVPNPVNAGMMEGGNRPEAALSTDQMLKMILAQIASLYTLLNTVSMDVDKILNKEGKQ